MRQAQKYQEKNYHLAWTGVARDDIRSMMGLTMERIQNYTLVATLFVGMGWACLLASSFSEGVPSIVQNAFWVSIAISIQYFALSIMFAVKGQNNAFVNTMRLLTWECRPENPARYDHDYMSQAQQFEKDGLRSIFRIPGMTAPYQQSQPSQSVPSGSTLRSETMVIKKLREQGEQGKASKPEDVEQGKAPKRRQAPPEMKDRQSRPLEEVIPATRQLVHLARFAHFMQLWQPFDTQAKNCIGIGLLSLVQGAMYYTLGKVAVKDYHLLFLENTALVTLTLMVIFMYIVVLVYQTSVKFQRSFTRWSVMVLFCTAPTMGCLAVLIPDPSWVRAMLAPLCALSHCLLFVIGFIQSFSEMKAPSEITEKFITGPNGQNFTASVENDAEHGREPHGQMQFDMSTTSPEEEAQATAVRDSVRRSVRASLLLASIMWFFVFLSTFTVFSEQESVAKDLQTVPLNWRSKLVWPHAIAVAGDVAYIADKYRVYQVNAVAGGEPQEVSCPLSGATIADVAATCEGELEAQTCYPLVLLEGESATIKNCNTGAESSIKQQPSDEKLNRFAIHSGSVHLTGDMLAKLGDSVVEYAAETEEGHAWRPLWEKIRISGDAVHGVDFDAQRLNVFDHSDASKVKVADLQKRTLLGSWTLPSEFPPLADGAATGDGSVLLLPKGSAPMLLKWAPPLV
jgi:hypothetical protein